MNKITMALNDIAKAINSNMYNVSGNQLSIKCKNGNFVTINLKTFTSWGTIKNIIEYKIISGNTGYTMTESIINIIDTSNICLCLESSESFPESNNWITNIQYSNTGYPYGVCAGEIGKIDLKEYMPEVIEEINSLVEFYGT